MHLSRPRRRARELHSRLISKTLKKTGDGEGARRRGVPRSTTGWMETYGTRLKYQGARVFSHFRCRDIGDAGRRWYVPFIPRNDDVRVCVRTSQHPRPEIVIGTHFGDHLSTDLTALGNAGPKTHRVDTKMVPLRAIVPEIDAYSMRHVAY